MRPQAIRIRIPIEGKFGQGKNGYRLNLIPAKLASTSEAWVRYIFLVMNLVALAKFLLPKIQSPYFRLLQHG
ncbi:MAG: transposase [Mariprofundaceae bacterium]|nr:transposase [Mariprofundaceae bacterium]